MFNYFRKELDWGGRKLILETGKIARQADGAVLARYGDTIVLCTAVGDRSSRPGQDFFPLTVHYQEKAFAAGKIPGGFFKREGRPSEAEVLKSRLIDRPIRPLFPDNFRNEVQVIATVLSHDLENDPDIVALIGCSAALTLSGIPFFGPVGAARVGYEDGQYILNPSSDRMKRTQLDLVVAGTTDGVLMVEFEAQELPEDVMLGAVTFGHESFQPVIQAIIELAEHAAKDPWTLPEPSAEEQALKTRVDALARTGLAEAYREPDKGARHTKVDAVRSQMAEAIAAEGLDTEKAKAVFHDLEADIVRNAILDTGMRIDGRDTTTVRPIIAEVGILPARMVRRCSPGARRRRSASPRWAPGRTSRSSTRSKASTVSTSCCTTISRPIRWVRPAAWAHRGGVRWGTASLPGGRCIRCCPARISSPTRCVSCPRSPSPTAAHQWQRCAAARLR